MNVSDAATRRGGTQPRTPNDDARDRLQKYRDLGISLGAGAFAEVTKHFDADNDRYIAIKRVKKASFKEGVNLGAVKELQALQELHHPNVLALYDTFVFGERIHLVLEFCEGNLGTLIRDASVSLSEAHVKGYFLQILAGLHYMHRHGMAHRDVKPDNILIDSKGVIKLGDLGHAIRLPDAAGAPMFYNVVTVWYRAPELLCCAPTHTQSVDMWAAGCVLAELLLRQPLFVANDPGRGPDRDTRERRDQLAHIYRMLGTPVDPLADSNGSCSSTHTEAQQYSSDDATEAAQSMATALCSTGWQTAFLSGGNSSRGTSSAAMTPPLPAANVWPGASALPGFCNFEKRACIPLADIMRPAVQRGVASELCLDLLSKLLRYDPSSRISAEEAMAHSWFSAEPRPCAPSLLPRGGAGKPSSGSGGIVRR